MMGRSIIMLLVGFADVAAADDRLVVASDPKLAARLGGKPIDAACVEPACLAEAGAASKRVISVTATGASFELVLVDVAGKELLGRRTVAGPEARLSAAIAKLFDEGPLGRAKELFAKGNEHYNLGEFALALVQYKVAYRITTFPGFLFNIAQCHRRLAQYEDAIVTYRSYLAGVPDADNTQVTLELIAESEHLLELQRADAQTDAARALAEREANARAAEAARKAKEAEAVIAQRRGEQARLEAALYDRHPARTWALVAGGVGGAAVITGTLVGLAARSRQTSFDDAGCSDPARQLDQIALAGCRDDRDRGERNALLANVFLFGGGAIVAAAAIVFVLDPGNVDRASLTVSPTGVTATVRW